MDAGSNSTAAKPRGKMLIGITESVYACFPD